MSKYNFTEAVKPEANKDKLYDGFHYDGRYLYFSKGVSAEMPETATLSIDVDNQAFCIKRGGDCRVRYSQGRNYISAPHLKDIMDKGRYLAVQVDHDGGAIYQLAKKGRN